LRKHQRETAQDQSYLRNHQRMVIEKIKRPFKRRKRGSEKEPLKTGMKRSVTVKKFSTKRNPEESIEDIAHATMVKEEEKA